VKPTLHQQRVLAALLALEQEHQCRWWSRHAIGNVVGAGGYHATIQNVAMRALKRLGLVQTERSAWPPEVRDAVRCGCACFYWGLTERGRQAARDVPFHWTPSAIGKVNSAVEARPQRPRDEDEWFSYGKPENPAEQ